MNQKSRRVRERTRGKEQSYFKGVFVEAAKQPGFWFGGWVWQWRQCGWSL